MNVKKLSILILLIALIRAEGDEPELVVDQENKDGKPETEFFTVKEEKENKEALLTPTEEINEQSHKEDSSDVTNSLELQVTKTWWFLIFRHVNFNFNLKSIAAGKETNKSFVASLWYFWSSYFEKFTGKTYKLKITNLVNKESRGSVEIEWNGPDKDNKWAAKNYPIPKGCEECQKVDIKIVDMSWSKLTKEYQVEYTCGNPSIEVQAAEKIVL